MLRCVITDYFHIFQHPELWEEDIDWWSKYYASIGELDKCKMYLESGYDKIQVGNNRGGCVV